MYAKASDRTPTRATIVLCNMRKKKAMIRRTKGGITSMKKAKHASPWQVNMAGRGGGVYITCEKEEGLKTKAEKKVKSPWRAKSSKNSSSKGANRNGRLSFTFITTHLCPLHLFARDICTSVCALLLLHIGVGAFVGENIMAQLSEKKNVTKELRISLINEAFFFLFIF